MFLPRQIKAGLISAAFCAAVAASSSGSRPPRNDQCQKGTLIPLGGQEIVGSTALATVDNQTACGSASARNAPGVWYWTVGTGHPLRASTCHASTDFDTQISVYTGEHCLTLNCVAGNDDGDDEETGCGKKSSVSWDSEMFVLYDILVHGGSDEKNTGKFGITIQELALTHAPSNDQCEGAHLLRFFHPTFGSTNSATVDSGVQACGKASASTTPGVWFLVTGTGLPMRVSTCDDTTTKFDTQISVFTGTCNALRCVDGDNDSCGVSGLQSKVTWHSKENTPYYVLVHGSGEADRGDFGVVVEVVQPPVQKESDPCSTSTVLPVNGKMIMGTTDGVAEVGNENAVEACGTASSGAGSGKWFYALGTGNVLRVSTCNSDEAGASEVTTFDTQISVFTGTCGHKNEMVCVEGDDDACGLQSTVTFKSEPFTFYDILVHGKNSESGNFGITLEEVILNDKSPPSNNECGGAHLLRMGHPTQSSNFHATGDDVSACGNASHGHTPGVWFLVMGTGDRLQVNTCDDSTDFDTQISVFTGSCNALSCIGGNDDSCGKKSAVTWHSEQNELYFILVHGGQGSNTGNFVILADIMDEPLSTNQVADNVPVMAPPSNDACKSAMFLPVNSQMLGSTFSGTADNVDQCGSASNSSAPGVWYWAFGTGDNMKISTCDFATFDTQISVFAGTCDSLICLDGNDDSCGTHSSVEWESNLYQPYYILINGKDSVEKGMFGIAIEDMTGDAPSNDICKRSHLLRYGVPTYSSTHSATMEHDLTCGKADSANSPGVWYTVLGTGHVMSVSTCGPATDFDTQISLFTGDCDNLVCTTSNDDYCGAQSTVSWESDPGVIYYALIHGSNNATGEFSVTVEILDDIDKAVGGNTTIPAPANDACIDAIPVQIGGDVILGSTYSATVDFAKKCGNATKSRAPGIWYRVTGTGRLLQASTCYTSTLNTQLSVYKGDCDDLICVDGDNDSCGLQSSVNWESELHVVYYIHVHGHKRERGNFGLTVVEELITPTRSDILAHKEFAPPPSPNNFCNSSQSLELGKQSLGSTVSATMDSVERCGEASASYAPGLWFKVKGTGNRMFASTCSMFTDFDTQISVFEGRCNRMRCVDGSDDDDACGSKSVVIWSSNKHVTYYILVHGSGGGVTGIFDIIVDELVVEKRPEIEHDLPKKYYEDVLVDANKSDDLFEVNNNNELGAALRKDNVSGYSMGYWGVGIVLICVALLSFFIFVAAVIKIQNREANSKEQPVTGENNSINWDALGDSIRFFGSGENSQAGDVNDISQRSSGSIRSFNSFSSFTQRGGGKLFSFNNDWSQRGRELFGDWSQRNFLGESQRGNHTRRRFIETSQKAFWGNNMLDESQRGGLGVAGSFQEETEQEIIIENTEIEESHRDSIRQHAESHRHRVRHNEEYDDMGNNSGSGQLL